jgi:hypothetical protein
MQESRGLAHAVKRCWKPGALLVVGWQRQAQKVCNTDRRVCMSEPGSNPKGYIITQIARMLLLLLLLLYFYSRPGEMG